MRKKERVGYRFCLMSLWYAPPSALLESSENAWNYNGLRTVGTVEYLFVLRGHGWKVTIVQRWNSSHQDSNENRPATGFKFLLMCGICLHGFGTILISLVFSFLSPNPSKRGKSLPGGVRRSITLSFHSANRKKALVYLFLCELPGSSPSILRRFDPRRFSDKRF